MAVAPRGPTLRLGAAKILQGCVSPWLSPAGEGVESDLKQVWFLCFRGRHLSKLRNLTSTNINKLSDISMGDQLILADPMFEEFVRRRCAKKVRRIPVRDPCSWWAIFSRIEQTANSSPNFPILFSVSVLDVQVDYGTSPDSSSPLWMVSIDQQIWMPFLPKCRGLRDGRRLGVEPSIINPSKHLAMALQSCPL